MPVCAACGQENPEGFRFCGACAAPLDERPAAMFANVTGSTGLGELLDSEALKDVMETWFSAMRTEIEAEAGTVEKFIGDAVMAAFGVPAAHEDDASRALRAALRPEVSTGSCRSPSERGGGGRDGPAPRASGARARSPGCGAVDLRRRGSSP